MRFGTHVRVDDAGIQVAPRFVRPAGIQHGGTCWGLWVKGRGDLKKLANIDVSKTRQATHMIISPIHPATWTNDFRFGIYLARGHHFLSRVLRLLDDSGVNVLSVELANSGYEHQLLTGIGEFVTLREAVQEITQRPVHNDDDRRDQLKSIGQVMLPAVARLEGALLRHGPIRGKQEDADGAANAMDFIPERIYSRGQEPWFLSERDLEQIEQSDSQDTLHRVYQLHKTRPVYCNALLALAYSKIWSIQESLPDCENPMQFRYDANSQLLEPVGSHFVAALNHVGVEAAAVPKFACPFYATATADAENHFLRLRFIRRDAAATCFYVLKMKYRWEKGPAGRVNESPRGLLRGLIHNLQSNYPVEPEHVSNVIHEYREDCEIGTITVLLRISDGDEFHGARPFVIRARIMGFLASAVVQESKKDRGEDIRVLDFDVKEIAPSGLGGQLSD